MPSHVAMAPAIAIGIPATTPTKVSTMVTRKIPDRNSSCVRDQIKARQTGGLWRRSRNRACKTEANPTHSRTHTKKATRPRKTTEKLSGPPLVGKSSHTSVTIVTGPIIASKMAPMLRPTSATYRRNTFRMIARHCATDFDRAIQSSTTALTLDPRYSVPI